MSKAIRCCQECGGALPPRKSAHGPEAKFCSTACRKDFNNRRMMRGAIFYDLYMKVRYQRATNAGDLSTMSTIARVFREEDELLRAGRKSWSEGGERDVLTEVFEHQDKVRRQTAQS